MSISQHQTASGRPLRVAPAWVGAASPAVEAQADLLPVREAVWIWSVRRYARLALWALPAAALLYGWNTLDLDLAPGPLPILLAAGWLAAIAMIALAGLLAGARTHRFALTGMLCGLGGLMLALPLAALSPNGAGSALTVDQLRTANLVASGLIGASWLLLGWAVFSSKLANPADGVLLMLASVAVVTGAVVGQPLPTVGALLVFAAGTGLAWTGARLIPRA